MHLRMRLVATPRTTSQPFRSRRAFLASARQSKPITIGDSNADIRVDFALLSAVAISLQGITVTAAVPLTP